MIPIQRLWLLEKGAGMQKVDGFYLYQVGAGIQPLKSIRGTFSPDDLSGTPYNETSYVLRSALAVLDPFLKNETYRLKTSLQKGEALKKAINDLIKKIDNDADKNKLMDFGNLWPVTDALRNFEAVVGSEFGLLDMYVITKKGGYDISELMVNGQVCFPKELVLKVPECIPDIQAGTKCIAVSLPTAAGFHLHRANEAVLHRYWDAVTTGADRPKSGNMGDYLNQLEQKNAGDTNVRSALKDLKNLHRNPLIHPDHTLESVEEAIALMDHIKAVIFHMLKTIPEVKPKLEEKRNYTGIAAALLAGPVDISSLKEANSDEILDESKQSS